MPATGSMSHDTYWRQGHDEAMERLADADEHTLQAAGEALTAMYAVRDYASRDARRLLGALAAVIDLREQLLSA